MVKLLFYGPSLIELSPLQLLLSPALLLYVVVVVKFGGMLGDTCVYLTYLLLKAHVVVVQSCKLNHINVVLRKRNGGEPN